MNDIITTDLLKDIRFYMFLFFSGIFIAIATTGAVLEKRLKEIKSVQESIYYTQTHREAWNKGGVMFIDENGKIAWPDDQAKVFGATGVTRCNAGQCIDTYYENIKTWDIPSKCLGNYCITSVIK